MASRGIFSRMITHRSPSPLTLLHHTRLTHSSSSSSSFFSPSQPPTNPSPSSSSSSSAAAETMPHYRLSFTCAPCYRPSVHHVSQQAYHHGSVLIICPHCRNRHVISDHLDILTSPYTGSSTSTSESENESQDQEGNRNRNTGGLKSVEEVFRKHGRLVKNGTLGTEGKVEFWAEGGKVGDDGGEGISGADVGGRSERVVKEDEVVVDDGEEEVEDEEEEEVEDEDEEVEYEDEEM